MKRLICTLAAAVIIAVGFEGCIESPVEQQSQIINGKVYGPKRYDYLLVSAGLQPVSFMHWLEDGFKLSISKKPYELYVYGFDHFWNYTPDFTLKYSNLSINDLCIISGNVSPYVFYSPQNHCIVDVHFPKLSESKIIGIKFVSEDKYMQSSDDIKLVFAEQSEFFYAIIIPEDKSSIGGKLYYLEITPNPRNRWEFKSFDKFGIKDVFLVKGYNIPVIFTKEDISYNPPEYNIPVNIKYPSGYTSESNILLSVPTRHKSSDLFLYHLWDGGNTNRIIPILPGNEFEIKVYSEYGSSEIFDSEGNEFIYVNPGEPVNFTHTRTMNMITPANQQKDVVETTQFEITDSDGPAVYEYSLCVEPEKYLSFYTTEKSIKFSDFRTAFFSPFKNKVYYWQVRKFPKFNSTDEFIGKPYVLDNRLNYVELSEARSFTTAP